MQILVALHNNNKGENKKFRVSHDDVISLPGECYYRSPITFPFLNELCFAFFPFSGFQLEANNEEEKSLIFCTKIAHKVFTHIHISDHMARRRNKVSWLP